jgi:predicted transcriptional regulator
LTRLAHPEMLADVRASRAFSLNPHMARNFLIIDPDERPDVMRGLSSPVRVKILKLLQGGTGVNVNDIAAAIGQPQSTVSANLQILENAGLIRAETQKGRKGSQKVCFSTFDEILVTFRADPSEASEEAIEVAMPIGLYTSCDVSAPCGLCSPGGVIGLLDVPGVFLNPDRMNAGLMWFTRGYVEYQFPNNARLAGRKVAALELSMELSSEVPGTLADWPSDITIAINGREVGTWTSPGDFGDHRGLYTPDWWKLKGSQYGKLKIWRVTPEGAYIDGMKVSPITLRDLDLANHHSIRLRIEVKRDARHPGGVNVFGRGFGNYDQDIVLRLTTAP